MDKIMELIDIAYLKANYPTSIQAELPGDLLVIDFDGMAVQGILDQIFELDVYFLVFCRKGSFDLEVNMQRLHISEDALLVNKPGNIIKVCSCGEEEVSFLGLVLSRNYFASINIDYNRLFNASIGILTKPCQTLCREDIVCLGQFFRAGATILTSDYDNKKEILGELLGAASYLLSSIWATRILGSQPSNDCSNRETAIFNDFLKLVTENHLEQRSVGFYADKLFITPKYLSKIIKNVSGLSAPDWINKMTVMEAKSLLKYSDLTITEIVWKLKFSSPSVFYKYFKRQTGITPTDYRNMNRASS